jgi:hypothetical protein
MTAFNDAWSLLKARPEEQLMGMGGDYSGGMTIDPRVMSMAGVSAGDLSRFAPALPDLPVDPSIRYDADDPRRAAEQVLYDKALARRQAEEQRRADRLALLEMGPTPMNPLAQDRSKFRPTRRNVERAPFTSDQELTREQLQAEAERMRAEGMSEEIIAQRQAQALAADTSVMDPSGKVRPLADTDYAEGFRTVADQRALSGLEGSARRQLGGGQKGLRMEASSRTPSQKQNVDPETGEIMERRKVRVKRGNMEGIATMGRGGKGFKQRSYEALGQNPDKREFKTRQERLNERMAARAAEMGATYTPPKVETKEPKPFQERLKPGSDAYDARMQQLEDQEELFTQMYSQPVVDPNTGKLVPNPRLGMAERIMQQITESPEPPTFTPQASRQAADDYQGDRPVFRPSTGQFIGRQFDEKGKPKMTSRGAPSMTGITPVDLEEMGRQAMVGGEIDPQIMSRYYDALDAAPVTADERRGARDAVAQAGLDYLQQRGLPTTSTIEAVPSFRTDIERLKRRQAEMEEGADKKTGYKL